jgi:hypothetical protein
VCLVLRGQDNPLFALHEVPRNRASEVADTDDRGCQHDSFLGVSIALTTLSSALNDGNAGQRPVA